MMGIVFSILIGLYLLFVLVLWMGWERLPVFEASENLQCSIIIPARNEESNISNILKDLEKLDYPHDYFEVVVIDDHSTDSTSGKVLGLVSESNYSIQLIELTDDQGKKAAIAKGIKAAKYENIITIDADCRVPEQWLSAMLGTLTESTEMVIGPVVYQAGVNFFSKILTLEFASLVGTAASTVGWGQPSMSNAANLLFRKSSYTRYLEEGLDKGVESGDDMFLMHSIAREDRAAVQFCKQSNAVVITRSPSSFSEFVNQRSRWAGKWSSYQDRFTKILAVLIFLLHLSIITAFILTLTGDIRWQVFMNLFVAKALFEFLYLRQVLKFLGRKMYPIVFLVTQVLYSPYVVLTAISSLVGTPKWKNRPLS